MASDTSTIPLQVLICDTIMEVTVSRGPLGPLEGGRNDSLASLRV